MENNVEEWTYSITPAFIARFKSGVLEVRRLDNDVWESNHDPYLWKSVIEDGTVVS
jgi:hypothetical protein